MTLPPHEIDAERTAPAAPPVPALELERLRREVKSRLFGSDHAPLTIDRYQILGCIGQGGMGIVYAARDQRLGRTVALKLLRPEFSRPEPPDPARPPTPGRREMDLTKEARSLARLAHPNVVAVFDVGEHEGQLFVAMEYVEGQSLRRWLETPRSLAATLDVYLAAGEGLAAAHRAGLVHRDFKPDNVLVGADGRPRILDFGLARAPNHPRDPQPPVFAGDAQATATSLSQHGVLLGTPAYMAPEQHLGERADARSDQFGFCVALYQALYRSLPFPTEDLRALSLAIVSGRVTPPPVVPGLPDRLRRLVARGLRVDPDARFPSMDALLTELRDIRTALEHGVAQRPAAAPEPEPAPAPAPAPAPEPEPPSYDTRAIERAFGLSEGRPADESGGRPGLSESEVAEIADEVGLDLHAPSSSELRPQPGPQPAPQPSEPLRFGERTHFGLPSTILAERELAALPTTETQRRIVRELERNLGGTGIVEQFEAGMTWANHEAEASIDRQPGGARLTLRRSFARLARKRRRRGMLLGFFAGSIGGGVLIDLIPAVIGAIEPVIVFGGMGLGVLAGLEVAKKIHARQMNEERALLEWVGERVEALIEASGEPRALRPSPEDRR
ncbi:serine/threonine-protein kinase [Enhygromyxa salina]|uniref:serine/threonine-protein kinase n=1 Tax=Enhygromyxa salina TaxID=215803 RepID=UPI0015E59D98|nr:serine/threonine-protein kinase [Enhygromyxa salina]